MFRFTIRDLLWLTVVVAVASYAYSDRRAMKLHVEKATAEQATEREKYEKSRAQHQKAAADLRSLFDTMIRNNEREKSFEKMREEAEGAFERAKATLNHVQPN